MLMYVVVTRSHWYYLSRGNYHEHVLISRRFYIYIYYRRNPTRAPYNNIVKV